MRAYGMRGFGELLRWLSVDRITYRITYSGVEGLHVCVLTHFHAQREFAQS